MTNFRFVCIPKTSNKASLVHEQLGARMKADADGAVSELCAVMTSVRFTVEP